MLYLGGIISGGYIEEVIRDERTRGFFRRTIL
jgi:hypothetical protein